MAEVSLSIHGQAYGISCDDGQEGRVADLGKYVDSRLREIAAAGAASNESHLLVLTALVLADEIYEIRNGKPANHAATEDSVQGVSEDDEREIVEAINHLALRIDSVSDRLAEV